MKVKNIMFSGFAAAILMGVGAANAVVSADTYNLANTGYVDAKINLVAGQKEAVANKMNATTAAATNLDDLAADEDNYPSVAAAVEIADKKAKAVVKDVNEAAGDLATLKGNVDKLMVKVDTEGNVAAAIAGALTDAKAYTDQEVGKVDAKVATNTSAIEILNGNGDGSVAKMAADAAAAAVEASGHAKAEDVARDYETKENATAKYATFETKENATAKYDTFETKTDAATNLQTAKDYADSAVAALKVAETYETKENATAKYDTFETKTDAEAKLEAAKDYTDAEIVKLNVSQYAKTADVEATYETKANVETALGKKLDSTALTANGTYMVTKTDNGIEYTAVTVATAADAK